MIHLHNHTEYSALDGLMKIDEMLSRAKELGAGAVAMTDHACISGLPEFYKKAIEAEIKPIIGCEFYCADTVEGVRGEKRTHLNVWAKNWDGVVSIMQMLTTANKQFYNKPRITLEQALGFRNCIVSTACCIGLLARSDYAEWFQRFYNTYGEDLVIEIMPHRIMEAGEDLQKICNVRGMELSSQYGTMLVATTDAHYARAEDAVTHDIMLAIQVNKSISDPTRWRMGPHFYMKSIQEMLVDFRSLGYVPDETIMKSMLNTKVIAERCSVVMPDFPIELPSPYSEPDDAVFSRKITEGYMRKIAGAIPAERQQEYKERLLYEVGVIKGKNFVTYFLIVEDMIAWAREHGIMVGPARGSSCGSLVCYLLDITQVDPLQFGLYFERFLNPERIDYPDIDVDFQDDRRAEVFEYIRNKYGHDRTASISTFAFLHAKSAFRDVARLSGFPMDKVNALSKLIEAGVVKDEAGKVQSAYSEAESFDYIPELVNFKAENPHIVEQAQKLDGRIRQMGVHAAGLVVSARPLYNCAAIIGREIESICWDKRTCESPFGLIKMDLLGLSTLSVINHSLKLIRENHGVEIDVTKIPLEDPKVMEEFCAGRTIGIFQFESSSSRHWLKAIGAKTFMEVTDVTALNRPGSLDSGETEKYSAIARGEDYEKYLCPQIEPILKSTKGILVYQEQMMRIFVELGGFTFAEADKMRKIVGKKLGKEEFQKHSEHFVSGCAANGISKAIAEEVFGKMVSFANYSFNLSHAVAYTFLSVWSMYLKVYYPVEYMCSLLSKTTKSDNIFDYIKECGRMGIVVKYPDINLSCGSDYTIFDGEIVAPLNSIKGVGTKAVEHIIDVRNSGGVFLGTKDFDERVMARVCNKRVKEALFQANAFFSLGEYEPDEQVRILNLKRLLDIFATMPRFDYNESRPAVDKAEISAIISDIHTCAEANSGRFPLNPVTAHKPLIMWVNNPTQFEDSNLKSPTTKWAIECLEEIGIKSNKVYYTSPLKCNFGQINSAPNECCVKCPEEFLRREIIAVQPRLIVCSSSQFMKFFGADSHKIGDMVNKVIYSEEFSCFIIFTYSPQYAKFNDTPYSGFMETMENIQKMFFS